MLNVRAATTTVERSRQHTRRRTTRFPAASISDYELVRSTSPRRRSGAEPRCLGWRACCAPDPTPAFAARRRRTGRFTVRRRHRRHPAASAPARRPRRPRSSCRHPTYGDGAWRAWSPAAWTARPTTTPRSSQPNPPRLTPTSPTTRQSEIEDWRCRHGSAAVLRD